MVEGLRDRRRSVVARDGADRRVAEACVDARETEVPGAARSRAITADEALVPEEAPVFKEATADEAADETASTAGASTADVPVVFSDQEDQSGSSS